MRGTSRATAASTPRRASATTSHAYAAAGTFTPKVTVRDEDGAGNASTTVRVTAPSVPPPVIAPPPPAVGPAPTALPVLTLARSGSKGRFTLRATCAERCTLRGTVTVTRKLARKLGRARRTLVTVRRSVGSTQRLTVKLPNAVLRALRKRRLRSLVVTARFTATYADGRRRTATRTLRVRR